MKKEEKDQQQKKADFGNLWLRSALWLGVIMLGLLLASLFFFRKQIRESAALLSGSEGTDRKGYYVLITESEDTDFWDGILRGAREAADEADIYLERAGERMNTTYTKAEQMELAIYSKVDGIILDADDSSQTTKLIHQAYQAGIPVVTVKNDNPASERVSFVNVSSASLSREYGMQICQLAKERLEGGRQEPVQVCVLLDADGAGSSQNIVLTGIQDYIASEGMASEINLKTEQIHNNSVFSAEEEIRDLFLYSASRLPADIMVCLNLQNTTCVYQTVLDYNLVGNVDILGFYNSETIQNALDKDIIRATIMVDTDQMGRDCVEALTEYRESGYVSDYYAAELSLLTKESNRGIREEEQAQPGGAE